jgi:hypothetical protein
MMKHDKKINIESLRQHGRWKCYDMPKRYADMLKEDFIALNGQYREELSRDGNVCADICA